MYISSDYQVNTDIIILIISEVVVATQRISDPNNLRESREGITIVRFRLDTKYTYCGCNNRHGDQLGCTPPHHESGHCFVCSRVDEISIDGDKKQTNTLH